MNDQIIVLCVVFILVATCLLLVIGPFIKGFSNLNKQNRIEIDDLAAQISTVVDEGISNAELEVLVGNLTESEGLEFKKKYLEESKMALNSLEDSIRLEKLQQMDILEKKLFPDEEN
jgi:predicted PurR-regulated permease PerM